jgi:magnesium chelatase subunit I
MTDETDPPTNSQHQPEIDILPYSRIVGQEEIKRALEIAYIAPQKLGGVLISGQRGTGKSTAARAFAKMVYATLPVTLPINATEDRVVGGWKIDALMKGDPVWREGLLEQAGQNRLLYVDEVNLLDDHIVNIILDVTSTGVLTVQREGQDKNVKVAFTLVGTMNPEEGLLRPQLLDRFGLMVNVGAETETKNRLQILNNVLAFEKALDDVEKSSQSEWLEQGRAEDSQHCDRLHRAREIFSSVELSPEMRHLCVQLCEKFEVEGNRGDYVLAIAARAYAALQGHKQVTREHFRQVALLALQHRRQEMPQNNQDRLNNKDREILDSVLGNG